MTEKDVVEHKKAIDGMTQMEMARMWRSAPAGYVYFDRTLPLFDYFNTRFKELGGFTPEISKAIG